jgi:hypothetical protein
MAEDGAGALTSAAALPDSPRVAPAAGVGAIEHRFRPTIYSQEQRFVLDGDTLHWHAGRQ